MNSLKIRFLTAAVFAMAVTAGLKAQDYQGSDPVGTLAYALPQTTLTFEVTAQREQFYAGPYAKYAKKYLGVEARLQDESTCRLKEIRMTPYVEADQSRRFVVTPGSGSSSFLQLSAQGLIAVGDGNFGKGSFWRFSTPGQADFSNKGVNSNLTSESATLYPHVPNQSAYNTVAIQQDMVVEKPVEQRAQEAAETIIQLRRKKIDIVTGNTDATFSGEALQAAIDEAGMTGNIKVYSLTGQNDAIQAVADGKMELTVMNRAGDIAKETVNAIIEYLETGETAYYHYTPLTFIDAENVADFIGQGEF